MERECYRFSFLRKYWVFVYAMYLYWSITVFIEGYVGFVLFLVKLEMFIIFKVFGLRLLEYYFKTGFKRVFSGNRFGDGCFVFYGIWGLFSYFLN